MAKFEFDVSDSVIGAIITILVASVFVYFAARMVLDRASILSSIATVVIGTFLSTLVWAFVGKTLGMVLAVIVWALVAAIFFRTRWVKGAIIGVVAWILWFLVNWVVQWVMSR